MTTLINDRNWDVHAARGDGLNEKPNHTVARLLNNQPSDVWVTNDLTSEAYATFFLPTIAGGMPLNSFGLLYHNGSPTGSIRWRAGNSLVGVEFAPYLDSSLGFGSRLRLAGSDPAEVVNAPGRSIGSGDFTIECKINVPILKEMGILQYHGGGTDLWIKMRSDGRIQAYSDPGFAGSVISPDPIAANTNVHIQVSFSVSLQLVDLYLDAVKVATTTGVTSPMCNGNGITIAPVSGERLQGSIDELRVWPIYGVVPDQTYISQEVSPGDWPGMIGYYRFNEEHGSLFEDNGVAGGFDGTVGATNSFEFPTPLINGGVLDPRWSFGHSHFYFAPGVTARYVRVDVIDTDNPNGEFSAGIVCLGNGWVLPRSQRIGGSLAAFADRSVRTESAGGQLFIRKRSNLRRFRLTFRHEELQEWLNQGYEIDYFSGSSSPVLVHKDLDLDLDAVEQKSMVFGLMQPEIEIVNSAFGVYEQNVLVTEII